MRQETQKIGDICIGNEGACIGVTLFLLEALTMTPMLNREPVWPYKAQTLGTLEQEASTQKKSAGW
jgi:hypothetical protein